MGIVPKLTKQQAGRLGGKKGGCSTSARKVRAVRINGKKGGRPKSPEKNGVTDGTGQEL